PDSLHLAGQRLVLGPAEQHLGGHAPRPAPRRNGQRARGGPCDVRPPGAGRRPGGPHPATCSPRGGRWRGRLARRAGGPPHRRLQTADFTARSAVTLSSPGPVLSIVTVRPPGRVRVPPTRTTSPPEPVRGAMPPWKFPPATAPTSGRFPS